MDQLIRVGFGLVGGSGMVGYGSGAEFQWWLWCLVWWVVGRGGSCLLEVGHCEVISSWSCLVVMHALCARQWWVVGGWVRKSKRKRD